MRNLHRYLVLDCKVSSTSLIIYYLSFIIYNFIVPVAPATAQPLMRDVFAAMPDSVLPLVTKNNRLDCIDFIENNMEAKVRNRADEYVTLETLTADYARFRTSAASFMEMKLLKIAPLVKEGSSLRMTDSLVSSLLGGVGDGLFILCVITTAEAGEAGTPRHLEDSQLRFLNADWSPLDSVPSLSLPSPTAFVVGEAPDSLREDAEQAMRSLNGFHPMRLSFSPDEPLLTATLQTAPLAVNERRAIIPLLQPLVFRWNGSAFMRVLSD